MKNGNEPARAVTLYCSLLKREHFAWVAQKAVEVGVAEIVPIISARTIKLAFKKERVQKIMHEAAEQSGRGVVPILHAPMRFAEALGHAIGKNNSSVLFDISGKPLRAITIIGGNRIGIFIGPEGGWDSTELEAAHTKNFQITSLGKLTLRAETAAIIGVHAFLVQEFV